jgi:MFS family permease
MRRRDSGACPADLQCTEPVPGLKFAIPPETSIMQHTMSDLASALAVKDSDSRVPGARLSVALLLFINLFNYIDRQILAAVELPISKTFFSGAKEEDALAKTGLLASAFLISYMITAPIFGWLADRMSRWLIIGVGVLLWTLASGGSGLAPTFMILLIARCFVGIGEGAYGPAAAPIIADLYPVSRRGAVLSWFYIALPLGVALGYMLGGFIGEHWGWRFAFYAVVPPGLMLGSVALFMRDPRRGRAVSASPIRIKDYLILLKTPSYVLDCGAMAALAFAIGGISYFMPRYLVYREAGSLFSANLIFGIMLAIGGGGATLLGGWLGDKLRTRLASSYFLISSIGIVIAVPPVLLLLATPFPWAWIWVFLAIFFLFFNSGPANTILANVTKPSIRATAFALNILIIHALGDAVSPPIFGKVVGPRLLNGQQIYHWNAAFILVASVMMVAGVLWLWGVPYLVRDMKRAGG